MRRRSPLAVAAAGTRTVAVLTVAAAFLATAVIGCASSPAPSASMLPSRSGGVLPGTLPEDCGQIDLRSPTGERVDLTGIWEGTGALVDPDETVWLVQVGDCVYGTAMNPGFLAQADDLYWTVANLRGRLTSDFRLPATAVILVQHFPLMADATDVTFLVGWDDEGRLLLSEDRQPGEVAARCRPLPLGQCPDPLILQRADDQVVPSPGSQ